MSHFLEGRLAQIVDRQVRIIRHSLTIPNTPKDLVMNLELLDLDLRQPMYGRAQGDAAKFLSSRLTDLSMGGVVKIRAVVSLES